MQESGDRDPSKLNITGGVQLLTRDKGTGAYAVKEVGGWAMDHVLFLCWGGGSIDQQSRVVHPESPHTHTHTRTLAKQVFLADGSGISGVSAAVRLPPSTTDNGQEERYLLGGWSDKGVLLCTRLAAAAAAGADPNPKQEL